MRDHDSLEALSVERCKRCDSADYLSDEYMDGVLYLWCNNCGDEAGY